MGWSKTTNLSILQPTCRFFPDLGFFGVIRQALNAVRFVVYKQFCNANKNFQGDQKRYKKIALGKSHGLGEIVHVLVHAVCIANWRCPEPKIYHIYIYIISIHIAKLAAIPPPQSILGLNNVGFPTHCTIAVPKTQKHPKRTELPPAECDLDATCWDAFVASSLAPASGEREF